MSGIMMVTGAPASGGGGGSPVISADKTGIEALGYSVSDTATITTIGGRTISSITLISGSAGGRITLGGTGGSSTTITVSTPASGIGSVAGTYRVACSTGETVDVAFTADWGT